MSIRDPNPLDQDAKLKQLLADVPKIQTKSDYASWRRPFLKRYERSLDLGAVEAAEDACQGLFKACVALLQTCRQLDHHVEMKHLEDATEIKPKPAKSIAQLSKQVPPVLEALKTALPSTQTAFRQQGYHQYHMAAVMVRDAFQEYTTLVQCADLCSKRRTVLSKVCPLELRQLEQVTVGALDGFKREIKKLGLSDAMEHISSTLGATGDDPLLDSVAEGDGQWDDYSESEEDDGDLSDYTYEYVEETFQEQINYDSDTMREEDEEGMGPVDPLLDPLIEAESTEDDDDFDFDDDDDDSPTNSPRGVSPKPRKQPKKNNSVESVGSDSSRRSSSAAPGASPKRSTSTTTGTSSKTMTGGGSSGGKAGGGGGGGRGGGGSRAPKGKKNKGGKNKDKADDEEEDLEQDDDNPEEMDMDMPDDDGAPGGKKKKKGYDDAEIGHYEKPENYVQPEMPEDPNYDPYKEVEKMKWTSKDYYHGNGDPKSCFLFLDKKKKKKSGNKSGSSDEDDAAAAKKKKKKKKKKKAEKLAAKLKEQEEAYNRKAAFSFSTYRNTLNKEYKIKRDPETVTRTVLKRQRVKRTKPKKKSTRPQPASPNRPSMLTNNTSSTVDEKKELLALPPSTTRARSSPPPPVEQEVPRLMPPPLAEAPAPAPAPIVPRPAPRSRSPKRLSSASSRSGQSIRRASSFEEEEVIPEHEEPKPLALPDPSIHMEKRDSIIAAAAPSRGDGLAPRRNQSLTLGDLAEDVPPELPIGSGAPSELSSVDLHVGEVVLIDPKSGAMIVLSRLELMDKEVLHLFVDKEGKEAIQEEMRDMGEKRHLINDITETLNTVEQSLSAQ